MNIKNKNALVGTCMIIMTSSISININAATCEDLSSALHAAFNTSTLQSFSFRKMWTDNRTCEFVLSSPCDPVQEAIQLDTVFQTFKNHQHFHGVRYLPGTFSSFGSGCYATILFRLPERTLIENYY